MEPFEKYKSEYKIVSATIASILTSFFIDRYSNLFKSNLLAYVTIVVFVVIIFFIGNLIIDRIIDGNVAIRKMLLGKRFIEGYWFDLSIIKESKTIKHGVLFKIEYNKGSYELHGITYSRKMERIATWKSISCTFFDSILFVQYESHTEYSATFIEHGVLQIQFESPANSYSGFYFDFSNSIRFIISGTKVSDEIFKKNNCFSETRDKEVFLHQVMKKEEESILSKTYD